MKLALRSCVVVLALAASLFAQSDRNGIDFLKDFRQALKIGNTNEMEQLIRRRTPEAINAVVRLCELVITKPSDQVEDEIAAMRKAWKKAKGTDFVNQQYSYFSLLGPEEKKARKKLIAEYDAHYAVYYKAIQEKQSNTLGEEGLVFEGIAGAFETIGDYFRASQCWIIVGECSEERTRGKDADLRRACEAYRKALETREKVELKDNYYNATKERFKELEYAGYGDSTKGPAARKAAQAAVEASAAFWVQTRFEMFTDIGAVVRPLYMADETYQLWSGLFFQAKGSQATFVELEKGESPLVIRKADSEVLVDADGDGEVETPLPLSGRITPVQITLGSGDEKRDWGFLATVGRTDDVYQDIKFNLGLSDENLTVYIAPAASVVATIGEIPIRIIDDNMDGIYGSYPLLWRLIGNVNGASQVDFDSIVIGDSKVARPWSEVQQIGDNWYVLESERRGKEIRVTPTSLPTGKLKLAFKAKGAKVDYLVVKGDDEVNANYFFNVAELKAGVDVPVGSYQIYCGRISKGKRNQRSKAIMLPGDATAGWNVIEGVTTVMELGAPFLFAFDVEQDDERVTVVGSSIHVTGRGRETYQRLWNCVAHPDVSIRSAGKKKGKKGGRMRSAETQDEVTELYNGDFKTLWFPVDLENEKKKPGEVEVQLVEKKNKLFGKIESPWKG